MFKNRLFQFISVLVLMFVSAWLGWNGKAMQTDLESQIITENGSIKSVEDWGVFIVYTDDTKTSTYGTENMLTGKAIIKPGREIHPPHQHTQEEFIYIVEGKGTWSMDGVETEAKAGDVMYAKPWDMHGITNTGNTPLTFFVVKWDNKGLKTPVLKE